MQIYDKEKAIRHLTQLWTLNGQGTNRTRRTMQGTFPYLTLRTYVNKHIKNTLHLHYTIKANLHNTTSCLRSHDSILVAQ